MLRFLVFIVSFIVVVYALSTIIFEKEMVLKTGKPFKFLVRPIDPSDPFRGKYVQLNFEQDRAELSPQLKLNEGDDIYVKLAQDEKGFAKIVGLSDKTVPGDFVKAKVGWFQNDDDSFGHPKSITINYPFDKFYMEEHMALQAESALRFSRTDSLRNAYARIFVKNGEAVIENVYVDGKKLNDYLHSLKK